MKTVAVIGAAILTMCLTSYNRQKPDSTRSIVLPSSHLIGCKLSGCSQMWLSDAAGPGVIFPQNVSVDIDDDGVLGVVAKYDKSTSVDDIRASIDSQYGKWVFPKDQTGPHNLWRVEPEKLAIQLAENNDRTKEVIYLSARAWQARKNDAPLKH